MRSAVRQVDDDLRTMTREAGWKVMVYLWFLMLIASVIMVAFAVSIGRENNSRLSTIRQQLDQAEAFDFAAFATTACRTCDGTELIIHDGTPIVVSPFLDASNTVRQFPAGIRTPCFQSAPGIFTIKSQTVLGSEEGVLVDRHTLLQNPQGLAISNYTVDCMDAAPCLLPASFCSTTFSSDRPYGPIYHVTRTNVGSGSDRLEHVCVCILDWDPVGEANRTIPYCTEPMLLTPPV